MNTLHVLIAVLSAYGDLLKRFVSGETALATLYGFALMMLGAMLWGGSMRPSATREVRLIDKFTMALLATYVFQFMTSMDTPFRQGLSHLVYMAVPLLYVVVIQHFWSERRFTNFAGTVLVLMLPVNVVGLVQYFYDPTFLISTVYAGEGGGVIMRNFLYGGTFQRFPAIYASADRYSAMALMQFACALILTIAPHRPHRRLLIAWILFNIACSIGALIVAGARSRILVVLLVVLLALLVYFARLPTGRVRRGVNRWFPIAFGGAVLAVAVAMTHQLGATDHPVIQFLYQSFSERDVQRRVNEAVFKSQLPEEYSFFGAGLGTVGAGGRPGEFGIASIWAESGLVWGGLILLAFGGILAVLTKKTLDAAQGGEVVRFVLSAMVVMVIVMALLTGLTSAFELSSGLILACAIAFSVRPPDIQAMSPYGRR